jgi:2-isopropylmalate synthase
MTYEIMTPDSVGISGNRIVLGKHSGRFALRKKVESLGFDLDREELDFVYQQFTNLADEMKTVPDDDILNLLNGNGYSRPQGNGLQAKSA